MPRSNVAILLVTLLLVSCGDVPSPTESVEGELITLRLDWEMPPRTIAPFDRGGALHTSPLPPSPESVNPSRWRVKLDGCASTSNQRPIERWDWEIQMPNGRPSISFTRFGECRLDIDVPELGFYPVRLTATAADGVRATQTFEVAVRDFLVVSIGDSIASGEGNPDLIRLNASRPEHWINRECHRSWWSGPALAARRLEQADKRSSVTFISVACSGASITASHSNVLISRQLGQVADLVRRPDGTKRPIDALLIQAGANDVGFGDLLKFCAIPANFCVDSLPSLNTRVRAALQSLPERYRALKQNIDIRLNVKGVHIAEYPDPTDAGNANGPCDLVLEDAGGVISGTISKSEARWARNNVVLPLRDRVRAAAAVNGWNFVGGITDAFSQHGYCARDTWIVNYTRSILDQGDEDGTMHPNGEGHDFISGRLFEAALKPLLTLPRRTRPVVTPPPPPPPPPTCGHAVGAPCCGTTCNASLGLRCNGGSFGGDGVCVKTVASRPPAF